MATGLLSPEATDMACVVLQRRSRRLSCFACKGLSSQLRSQIYVRALKPPREREAEAHSSLDAHSHNRSPPGAHPQRELRLEFHAEREAGRAVKEDAGIGTIRSTTAKSAAMKASLVLGTSVLLILAVSTPFAAGLVVDGGSVPHSPPAADAAAYLVSHVRSGSPSSIQLRAAPREDASLSRRSGLLYQGKSPRAFPHGIRGGRERLRPGGGVVSWERGGGRVKLVTNALKAGKAGVCVIGSMWCYGCLHGLWSLARVAMVPGGLNWIEEQSSHGLVGVLLFVTFTIGLLLVQLIKLWSVVVATSAVQVKRSFLCLATFNIFFVYMCSWRIDPGAFPLMAPAARHLCNPQLFHCSGVSHAMTADSSQSQGCKV